MFTKRQMAGLYFAAVMTAVFVAGATYLELKHREPSLAHYRELPPFKLTNQDGKLVTLDDWKGQVWLADFVYTTCPGPCPTITAHMGRLQQKLPPEVRLASFSTDPESDTPAVLKAYAEKFNASDRWTFITGPKNTIYDLIRNGFMLAIASPPGAQIIHSTKIMLVDKNGTVRGFYDGDKNDEDPQILADVQQLLEE